MNLPGNRTAVRTKLLLGLVIVSSCIAAAAFCNSVDSSNTFTNWSSGSAFFASFFLVAGILLSSALLVVAARATVLTWITVLVLLAFAGKRRRVLVQQERKITADVLLMFLFKGCA